MKKLPCFTLSIFLCMVMVVSGGNWEEEFLDLVRGKEQLLLRDKRENVEKSEKQKFREGVYFVEISNEMRPVEGGKRDRERRKGMPSIVGGSERPYLYPGESVVKEFENAQEFKTAVTLAMGKLTDMYHPGVMEKEMAKRYSKDFTNAEYVGSLKISSYHKWKFVDKVLLDKGQEPEKLRDAFKATTEFCMMPYCNVAKFLDKAVVECEYDEEGSMVCFGIDEGEEEEEEEVVGSGGGLVMDSGGGVTDLEDVAFFSVTYEDWDGKKARKGKSRRKKK